MSLAGDTALEPLGDGRWRGEVFERWFVERGPFGGFVSAMLVRAAMAAVQDPKRLPRTLSVHFIDAPKAGPVEVAVTQERVGRSTTALSLRLEQDGTPVVLAIAGLARWRDGEAEWADASAPPAPAPEDCPPVHRADGMPRFVEQLAVRWVDGAMPGGGGAQGRNLAWLRPKEGGPLDALAVTALSDGWMPAALSKLGRLAIVPTFDLTIHFRAPLPATGDWLLAEYRTRFSAGGAWEEDGELWTQDGALVAQSRQLAMMRERR